MNSPLLKFAVFVGGIGLLIILGVILSKTSYPNLFFSIGTFAGLVLVFISVVLMFIGWSKSLYDDIKKK